MELAAAACLLLLALLLIGAISSNLAADEPLWPTADERADLFLGLAALAAAFFAGTMV
jgi:hypothetical protein